ncbi:hypothetical protein BSLG_010371 [Batrachochytrium salamandrivorans]|nr:hypothetical protein BSLG_010371 [Batrachochytrium salamandrivorans]
MLTSQQMSLQDPLYNTLHTLFQRETLVAPANAFKFSTWSYMRSLYSSETDIQSSKDADGQRSPPYACRYSHSCVSDGLYFVNAAFLANWRFGSQRGKLLAVVGEAGCVSIFNTSNTLGRPTSTWFAHDNAIFDCAWSHDNKQLITASGDAYIRLWDIETQKCVMGFRGHRGSVKSVSWCPTQPDVISTASRDGRIMVWDRRFNRDVSTPHSSPSSCDSRPVIVIPYAHLRPAQLNMMLQSATKLKLHTPKTPPPPKYTASVTAVTFLTHSTYMIASVGAADGLVKFWDLRAAGTSKNWRNAVETSTPPKTRKRSFGFSSLSLNNAGTKLYASCLDNSIHEFNTHALGAPVRQLSYPSYQCNSFYIRTSISPDDSTLMSGSMDGGVYLWDIQNPTPRPPLILKGHTSETSGVAWCNADIGQASDIATCSDDMTVRVWRAGLALASLPDDPGSVHLRGFAHQAEPIIAPSIPQPSLPDTLHTSSLLSSIPDSYTSLMSDGLSDMENIAPSIQGGPFYESVFSEPDISIEGEVALNGSGSENLDLPTTPTQIPPTTPSRRRSVSSRASGSETTPTSRKRKTVTPKSRSGSQTPRSLPLLSDSTRLNLRSAGQSTEEGNTDKKNSTRNGMSILNYFHAIPAVSTGSSSALLIPADVPANTTSS